MEEAKKEVIQEAHQAWQAWMSTTFAHRASLMRRVSEDLRQNKTRYAHIITKEMGKVINAAESEVEKCAWVCRSRVRGRKGDFGSRTIIHRDSTTDNPYTGGGQRGLLQCGR